MTPGERGTARAADGFELAVTRFPAQGETRGTLLVVGAMGVRQDFYAALAGHYAQGGFHVTCFDFRGMGWSRRGSLRLCDASLLTWVEQDLNAMLHEARKPAPALPLMVLGHSLGGQVVGIAPDNALVHAMVTVTAGTGWYRHNDRMPVGVRIFWFAAIPLLTPLFGYFPGKALRMVGDLPREVAWQWRRWCLHRRYMLGENPALASDFGRVRCAILGYSFEDDHIITRPAIDEMHAFYNEARVERRHLAPADIGERRIGHFGFFSERSRETLWRQSLDWLREQAR